MTSRVVGYRDGECDLVDAEAAISRIADVIARSDRTCSSPSDLTASPATVTTAPCPPGSPKRGGGSATELLYATMSDDFVARHADLHDRIGLFAERALDGPASYPPDQIALACELSEVELDRKRRALARHASQTGPLAALMGEDTYRRWWRTEWFRRPTAQEAATCARCLPRLIAERAVETCACAPRSLNRAAEEQPRIRPAPTVPQASTACIERAERIGHLTATYATRRRPACRRPADWR